MIKSLFIWYNNHLKFNIGITNETGVQLWNLLQRSFKYKKAHTSHICQMHRRAMQSAQSEGNSIPELYVLHHSEVGFML